MGLVANIDLVADMYLVANVDLLAYIDRVPSGYLQGVPFLQTHDDSCICGGEGTIFHVSLPDTRNQHNIATIPAR